MAINQCAHGCTHHRYITITIGNGQQCIGFFHTRGHDAAWPMIFETPVNHSDAVGQQCGCNGVALVTLKLLAIELERQWLTAINPAARSQAIFLWLTHQ